MARILNFIVIFILLVSCNKAELELQGEGAEELIGKWKLVKMERVSGDIEVDNDAPGDMFLDFKANGTLMITWAGFEWNEDGIEVPYTLEIPKKYRLSVDKKQLISIFEGGEEEIAMIRSLTATELVYDDIMEAEVVGSGEVTSGVIRSYFQKIN